MSADTAVQCWLQWIGNTCKAGQTSNCKTLPQRILIKTTRSSQTCVLQGRAWKGLHSCVDCGRLLSNSGLAVHRRSAYSKEYMADCQLSGRAKAAGLKKYAHSPLPRSILNYLEMSILTRWTRNCSLSSANAPRRRWRDSGGKRVTNRK